jgi:hypothetical protein
VRASGLLASLLSSVAFLLFVSNHQTSNEFELASEQNPTNAPVTNDHLLPAPPSTTRNDVVKLDVGGQSAASVKYDALGPLVVNSDGVGPPDRVRLIAY